MTGMDPCDPADDGRHDAGAAAAGLRSETDMGATFNFVLVLGMQRYSEELFRRAEAEVRNEVTDFRLQIFQDGDVTARPAAVEAAIAAADCLFLSLIHFTDIADLLVPMVEKHDPAVVLGFESIPEIMKLNKVGNYAMKGGKGMPKPVQNVARLLVGGRQEDTLYGYVKLQKITSKLLNFLPGKKLTDFRNWTNISNYWTHRSVANTANMFKLIIREYLGRPNLAVASAVELPTMGFSHPDAPQLFGSLAEYERWEKQRNKGRKNLPAPAGTVAVMSFRAHILSGTDYHAAVVRALEAEGLRVLPIFVMGIENHVVVREWLTKTGVDLVINTMGFSLVGGPAGASNAGQTTNLARELLSKLDTPYIVAQPLYVQDEEDWKIHGVGPLQSTFLYSLPEMDGAIAPVVLGGMQGSAIHTVPDRLARLARLARGFARLRHRANADKKIAVVVYNYPPGQGKTATAALLDVPASLIALLDRLKADGYHVGNYPRDPATFARCLEGTLSDQPLPAGHPPTVMSFSADRDAFNRWLRPADQDRINRRWGSFPGDIAPLGRDKVRFGGMQIGNIYIGVQPAMGIPGDPMRLLFDKENAPHHQYALFYKYLSQGFGADALVHMGMHGTVEWMPGVQLGVTEQCWPDVLLGELPHFYVYPINNPAEANIAKRRGYSTIVGHAIPPYGRAGLYKELQALQDLLAEYRERPQALADEEQTTEALAIVQKLALLNLDNDLVRQPDEPFSSYASRAYAYLRDLSATMITDRLHVLGSAPPADEQLTLIVETLKIARDELPGIADLVLHELGEKIPYAELLQQARRGESAALALRDRVDTICNETVERAVLLNQPLEQVARSSRLSDSAELAGLIQHGRTMLAALRDNTQELDYLLHGLNGRYIPAAPGGDIIRDGASVLPTGRNIHSLDPFRVPSDNALARGIRIAEALLEAHRAENNGEWPETIAQVLWGLDAIKTKGEAIGTILGLIGARPIKDGQGKIGRYGLLPLSELGRPRIDVLMTASGVFRDTFAGTMDMLDKLVRDAAQADEAHEQNYIRKHVDAMVAAGQSFDAATARLFTQAAGTYGTDVDDAIEGSAWEERQELEELFIKRNAYAFGGKQDGGARPDVLRSLLGTVGRVAQEIDSVEYGLTDMQHYYGYSGALKAAAERATGSSVPLNYIESFTAETRIQTLDQTLRVEYRTKLLNPKWYEGMLKHGHNGAAEISSRFTYMLGWSATTDAVDQWVYQDAAQTFVLDDQMRQRIEAANPAAARSMVGRLLEANSRGIWAADDATLERLRDLHADLEDRLEGVR